MKQSILALATFAAVTGAQGAAISYSYSGYGASGDAQTQLFAPAGVSPNPNSYIPVAGSAYNTNNVDTSALSGNVMSTPVSSVIPFASSSGTAQRLHSATVAGTGSFMLTGSTTQQSVLDGVSWDDGANRQLNGSQYTYVGFTVDEPGTIMVTLKWFTGNQSVTLNGGYGYYGLGGGGSLAASGTAVWTAPAISDQGSPAANNPAVVTRATTVPIAVSPGVTYQLNYNSYQYAGFGGPADFTRDTGVSFSVAFTPTSVPEPGISSVLALAGLALGLRRRR
jgi:hypothetical protein